MKLFDDKKLNIILGLSFSVLLTGCSSFQGKEAWFRNRGKDYHQAQVIPSLEVPAEFHVKPHVENHPIPKGYDANKKDYKVSILPPSEPSLQKSAKK